MSVIPDDIQAFLEKLYLELEGTERVALIFTPLELEQLNNLLDIGMKARKSYLMKEAKKEGRILNKWERHLLKADRNLWQKIRDGEKIAFAEMISPLH